MCVDEVEFAARLVLHSCCDLCVQIGTVIHEVVHDTWALGPRQRNVVRTTMRIQYNRHKCIALVISVIACFLILLAGSLCEYMARRAQQQLSEERTWSRLCSVERCPACGRSRGGGQSGSKIWTHLRHIGEVTREVFGSQSG